MNRNSKSQAASFRSQKQLAGSIPTCLILVDWKPVSPNQLLRKHWSEVTRNKNAAKEKWVYALLSQQYALVSLTTITTWLHSSPCATKSAEHSNLTTETHESHGDTSNNKPADENA